VKRPVVWFAPTLADARRARARAGGGAHASARDASPRSTAALVPGLATGEKVRVVDPPRPNAAWERAKRRVLLPPAPSLLRDAIGGIAAQEPPPGTDRRRSGPTRAHWIPGDLTDARAASLLRSDPVPALWIVEDFRRLRLSRKTLANVEERGIEIAAYRAVSPVRGRPSRATRSRAPKGSTRRSAPKGATRRSAPKNRPAR
jgi:hypothetical protein